MLDQRDAILRLLRDDDPTTVSLVKQQLATTDEAALADLQELLAIDDETVTRHVREVLGEIDAKRAARELTRLCEKFPERGELEDACFTLARALRPGIDLTTPRRLLEQWGRRLGNIAAGIRSPEARVRLAASFVGEQLGFRGNTDDYYNLGNSLIPHVIESRLGIPISLTLLYMFLGERAGLKVEGINFPGHFLARHERVLFDPFDRGRILTPKDCREILQRQKLPAEGAHFVVATPRMILRRLLANALYAVQHGGEKERGALIAGWIRVLDPRKNPGDAK